MSVEYNELALKDLYYAVVWRAAKDANLGDINAAAWLLTEDAEEYAHAIGLEDGLLGELAYYALKGILHGRS